MVTQKKVRIVKLRTAQITMIVLGLLAIIFSIKTTFDLTPFVFSLIGFGIALAGFTELGVVRLWKATKLKNLSAQQYLAIGIHSVVLINAIIFAVTPDTVIPVISGIATGTYLTSGILIILEAFTSF